MNTNKRNATTTSSDSNRSKKNIKKKRRIPIFPERLYDMLENAETNGYSHIISWLPDGKAFQIRGDEKAIVEVLRQCADFNLTRFKSFLRQLQLYGFERQVKGQHQGECKHSFFIRGRKDLLKGKSMIDFQNATFPATNIGLGGVIDCQKGILCQQQQPQQQQVHVLSSQTTDSVFNSLALKENISSNNDTINFNINNNKEAEIAPIITEPIPTKLENLILPKSYDRSKIHQRFHDKQYIPTRLENLILPVSDHKINQSDPQNDDVYNVGNGADQLNSIVRYYTNDDTDDDDTDDDYTDDDDDVTDDDDDVNDDEDDNGNDDNDNIDELSVSLCWCNFDKSVDEKKRQQHNNSTADIDINIDIRPLSYYCQSKSKSFFTDCYGEACCFCERSSTK